MTTAVIAAAAHGGTARLTLLPGSSTASSSNRRRTLSSGVRCALLQPQRRVESRRLVSLSLVFLQLFSFSNVGRTGVLDPFRPTAFMFLILSDDLTGASLVAAAALAANIMDKYVKKKRLDPLEAYIPAVILTEIQIKELGQYLEDDQPKFADCRSLLRSGPASSLRVNIRAVAEYASDAGNGKYAFNEVDQCLRALEELDSLLLRASRKDSGSSVEAMKGNVATALDALNGLLKTVPAEVLDRGKAMADAYLNQGEEDTSPRILDPQLQKLESIL